MAKRYRIKTGQNLLQVAQEGGYSLPLLLTANPGVYQVTTGQRINLPLGGAYPGGVPLLPNNGRLSPGAQTFPLPALGWPSILPLPAAPSPRVTTPESTGSTERPYPAGPRPLGAAAAARANAAAAGAAPLEDEQTPSGRYRKPPFRRPIGIQAGFVTLDTPNGPVEYQRAFTQQDLVNISEQSGLNRRQIEEQLKALGYQWSAGQLIYSPASTSQAAGSFDPNNPSGNTGGWTLVTMPNGRKKWVLAGKRAGPERPKVKGETTRVVSGALRTGTG